MIENVASAPDPFIIPDASRAGARVQTDGLALVHPNAVSGESTAVFITAGQSNGAGASFVEASYTPAQSRNHMLSYFNGGMYATADPLVGGSGSGGSWGSRLADKLISDGVFDRVILVPTDIGATSVQDWTPAQGLYFQSIITATRRVHACGLPVTAYLWHQGERDNVDGTSQANYASRLTSIISAVRAHGVDFAAPWVVGKCSYNGGATSAGVRAAQASVVNGTDIFQGGDTDTLTGTSVYRSSGDVHFTAAGANAAAELWKSAIASVFG